MSEAVDNNHGNSRHRDQPLKSDGPTVLQVIPALDTGGAERGAVDVARAIVEAGGRCILVSSGGRMTGDLQRSGAEHITMQVDSKNPLTIARNATRLTEICQREKVHIIHARSRAPAWSAWLAARRAGCHFVTTFHGTYNFGSGLGGAIKRRYNAIMTRGERVIAISRFIADHIAREYGVSGRVTVISRGIDLTRFNPGAVSAERIIHMSQQWRLPDGAPVIMLPGRLTRWKGQTVLIEAFAAIKHPDAVCVLVGSDQGRSDYRAELDKMIEERNLGGRFRLVDHCDDMSVAYMLADIVISASTDPEAFGRIAVESQAMGRPIIASDHGGSCETVEDGKTGFLTPPGDATALAAAIDQVLAIDDDARAIMARRAQTRVSEKYTVEGMCARTLDVYRQLLASQEGR